MEEFIQAVLDMFPALAIGGAILWHDVMPGWAEIGLAWLVAGGVVALGVGGAFF